jgi:hypothetical protein
MKEVLPICILIDAAGWEIVKDTPFLKNIAPHRKRLNSVFGYSSACIPSIVSGRWPESHRNWCYFVYDPIKSPFRSLTGFKWLPRALTGRRRVRRLLTAMVRKRIGFEGYFDLYNIPFDQIHLYDFSEKKSPLRPGGMNCGPNIFDHFKAEKLNYWASDPDKDEAMNYADLLKVIDQGEVDFAFSYWPKLDGLLHEVGNKSPKVPEKLEAYQKWIDTVVATARRRYKEVQLDVFSDHGMANCDVLLDLKSKIEALSVRAPDDFAVVYDSTMARFWFFNDRSRKEVVDCLKQVPQGRILPDDELKNLQTYFPDHAFGELIFLVQEGVLIVPSHMGERPIRAMHGYHPTDKHSYATICSSQEVPDELTAIPHLCELMKERAHHAQLLNQGGKIQKSTGRPDMLVETLAK